MRKLYYIFIVFTIFLTGCEKKQIDLSFHQEILNFQYKSDLYKLEDELPLYFSDKYSLGVPFVKGFEFIDLLSSSAQKHSYEMVDDVLKVYYYDDSDEEVGRMEIDFLNQTLMLSSYDVIDYLVLSKAYSDDNLRGLDFNDLVINEPQSLTIDLSKYGIPLENYDGEYYMPLYLANFLFSGYDLEIVYMYDSDFYLFAYSASDDFESSLPYDGYRMDDEFFDDVLEQNVAYLGFLFDNFYGLINYHEVVSYIPLIEEYKVVDARNGSAFEKNLNTFLASLNDLHTSQIQPSGFIDSSNSSSTKVMMQNSYILDFITSARVANCSFTDQNVSYYLFDEDTLYIEVNSYDGEIMEEIERIMQENVDRQYVYFDIRCNTGGFLGDMNHLLKFMSDEWSFYYGDLTGSFVESKTVVESSFALDRNFYLVTSGFTFSAANLTSSIVKDNQLATIVGDTSGGGTAAIYWITLPDGTALQISGPSVLLQTSEQRLIEDGIEPDIILDFSSLNKISYEDFLRQIVNHTKGY